MNRFKQHLKKYQHVYIAAGAFAAGVFVVLSARKSVTPGEAFDEVDYYQLGGEKSPLKYALTASDANAYNRVSVDMLNGGLQDLGEGKVLFKTSASASDLKVYNRVADLTNTYIKTQTDGGIPGDLVDDSEFYLKKLDKNEFVPVPDKKETTDE